MDVPNHGIQVVASSCGLIMQVKGHPVCSAEDRIGPGKLIHLIMFHHRVLGKTSYCYFCFNCTYSTIGFTSSICQYAIQCKH